MDIGSRIREYRLQRGLTQEELASRCELTKGYISQLENDVSSPSIATLIDVLNVLGVTPQQFFAEEKEEQVVFGKADFFQSENGDGNITWLIPNSQKNEMEPIILTLPVGGSSEPRYPFEGEEFGYVIAGTIKLTVGKRAFTVQKGETFYYKADKKHSIENVTDEKATVLWISCPPNF